MIMGLQSFLFITLVALLASRATHAQTDEQDLEVATTELITSAEENSEVTNDTLRILICKEPGKFCDGCNTVVNCLVAGTGVFSQTVERCTSPNNYCLVTTLPPSASSVAGCTTTAFHPICNGVAAYRFPCPAVGTFPHPFYCDRFIVCTSAPGSGVVFNCPSGYAYDATYGQCIVPKVDIIDQGTVTTAVNAPGEPGCNAMNNVFPVPLCISDAQKGKIVNYNAENSRLYYECSLINGRLYPVIKVCPYKQKYGDNGCA